MHTQRQRNWNLLSLYASRCCLLLSRSFHVLQSITGLSSTVSPPPSLPSPGCTVHVGPWPPSGSISRRLYPWLIFIEPLNTHFLHIIFNLFMSLNCLKRKDDAAATQVPMWSVRATRTYAFNSTKDPEFCLRVPRLLQTQRVDPADDFSNLKFQFPASRKIVCAR